MLRNLRLRFKLKKLWLRNLRLRFNPKKFWLRNLRLRFELQNFWLRNLRLRFKLEKLWLRNLRLRFTICFLNAQLWRNGISQNWKQNNRKRAHNSGKEYMTQCNKKVEERRLKFHRCGKCTNHCNDLLPENKLFHNYWKMGNWQWQRDYIAHHAAIKTQSERQ